MNAGRIKFKGTGGYLNLHIKGDFYPLLGTSINEDKMRRIGHVLLIILKQEQNGN
jgi:hypothetical protein